MVACESVLHHLLPPVRSACLLVPELTLSILTSMNPLWHLRYEEAMARLDRSDPWWAFLWPGSQGLARYLLDNTSLSQGRRVLDIGCGCGASAIASKMAGAHHVTANDIDNDALIATRHNARLNNVMIDCYSSDNLLQNPSLSFSKLAVEMLVVADMCYDDQLAKQISNLIDVARQYNIHVLLADPGRYSFKSIVFNELNDKMKCVCEYLIIDRDYMEPDFKTIRIWST